MTILDRLAGFARERVEQAKGKIPPGELMRQALAMPKGNFAFENALKKPGISFICECKKASPSKGLIAPDFPYLQIAREYENAGADCISVLTEPKWFLGSDLYLKQIADAVSIPCLRKDFTVDPYMLYEAKVLGASAVLLICSILNGEQIKEYLGICDRLGLSALTEAHDEKEVETALGARRTDHRRQQPQPEGFFGGSPPQPRAAGADPPGRAVRFRKRGQPCRGRGKAPGDRRGRRADRRSPDESA